MKIAIAQCNKFSDKMELMMKAMALKADLLLYPELIDIPYTFDYGIMTGSGYEEHMLFGKPYNTYELVQDSVLLKYRKQNLFPEYDDGRRSGKTMPHIILNGLKTYVCICFDIRNPWVFEQMKQPNLIIIPADFPFERIQDWCRLLKLRALEKRAWVVGVNTTEGGHSMIVRPDGEIVTEADRGEILLWGDVG
jgi:predicted amidohydrolase